MDYNTNDNPTLIEKLGVNKKIEIISTDSYVDEFLDWFTWNIINWSDWGSYVVTWDNTLYYNDNYWFAMKLWKEWNWAKIEIITLWEELWEENEWPIYPIIDVSKPKIKDDWSMDWYSILRFPIMTKIQYEKAIELSKGGEMCDDKCSQESTIGHNNKYYFQLGYTNMDNSDIYIRFIWMTTRL